LVNSLGKTSLLTPKEIEAVVKYFRIYDGTDALIPSIAEKDPNNENVFLIPSKHFKHLQTVSKTSEKYLDEAIDALSEHMPSEKSLRVSLHSENV
jgi:hypothetical protein